jgi:hypothetical protein
MAVDHFNQWRRKKTNRGSQDDRDTLKKVEEGNDKVARRRLLTRLEKSLLIDYELKKLL